MKWDMIIAFPPCTYLTNAGSMRLRVNGEINEERMQKAREAKEFFMAFYNADCPHIAIENPVPGKIHELPPRPRSLNHICLGMNGKSVHAYGLKVCRLWWQQMLLNQRDCGLEQRAVEGMNIFIPDTS
jgi:hypothetical protein